MPIPIQTAYLPTDSHACIKRAAQTGRKGGTRWYEMSIKILFFFILHSPSPSFSLRLSVSRRNILYYCITDCNSITRAVLHILYIYCHGMYITRANIRNTLGRTAIRYFLVHENSVVIFKILKRNTLFMCLKYLLDEEIIYQNKNKNFTQIVEYWSEERLSVLCQSLIISGF